MAYTERNFPTKKALIEAVKKGDDVYVMSVGTYPANKNGREYIEGPHYPQPHRFYVSVEVADGKIVKINK